MLTSQGFVAEATSDNIFVVDRGAGWRESPSAVKVRTPSGEYCLNGITRALVMGYAGEMGYTVEESSGLVPKTLKCRGSGGSRGFLGYCREISSNLSGCRKGLANVTTQKTSASSASSAFQGLWF